MRFSANHARVRGFPGLCKPIGSLTIFRARGVLDLAKTGQHRANGRGDVQGPIPRQFMVLTMLCSKSMFHSSRLGILPSSLELSIRRPFPRAGLQRLTDAIVACVKTPLLGISDCELEPRTKLGRDLLFGPAPSICHLGAPREPNVATRPKSHKSTKTAPTLSRTRELWSLSSPRGESRCFSRVCSGFSPTKRIELSFKREKKKKTSIREHHSDQTNKYKPAWRRSVSKAELRLY